MMYLLAILLPPVAVLFTGRKTQALLNLLLTILFYVPGAVHAILVVNEHKANERMEKQMSIQREITKSEMREMQRMMAEDDKE